MTRPWTGLGAGWILAVIVLLLVVVALVFNTAMPAWLPLALIASWRLHC